MFGGPSTHKGDPVKKTMVCLPKLLPRNMWRVAARIASDVNPINHPPVERLMGLVADFMPNAE